MRQTTGRRLAAVLSLIGTLLPFSVQADERKQLAFDTIDRNAAQMTLLSDSLFYLGELGMQEFESAKLLKETLETAGFKVELGGAGMPTNVWAEYGSGRPKIVIVTEVDALPGGSQTAGTWERKPLVEGRPRPHGRTQHPWRRRVGRGVCGEAGDAAHNMPGTVAISFGPAEEQLISRPFLVRAGYFKDVDAIIYLHIQRFVADRLRPAELCRDQLDFHLPRQDRAWRRQSVGRQGRGRCRELMDIGFDKLREHLRPTYRAHRTITIGGIQPNIIADTGQIWWFVRDANMPDAKETYEKL